MMKLQTYLILVDWGYPAHFLPIFTVTIRITHELSFRSFVLLSLCSTSSLLAAILPFFWFGLQCVL